MRHRVQQRKFPRHPYRVPVLVREGGQMTERYCRLERIGRGGCGLTSPTRFASGESLALEICLGGGVLRVTARIIYQRSLPEGAWDVGVELLDVHPLDRGLLEVALLDAGAVYPPS